MLLRAMGSSGRGAPSLPPASFLVSWGGLTCWGGRERDARNLRKRKKDPRPDPVPEGQRAALQAGPRGPHPHLSSPTSWLSQGLGGRMRGH